MKYCQGIFCVVNESCSPLLIRHSAFVVHPRIVLTFLPQTALLVFFAAATRAGIVPTHLFARTTLNEAKFRPITQTRKYTFWKWPEIRLLKLLENLMGCMSVILP